MKPLRDGSPSRSGRFSAASKRLLVLALASLALPSLLPAQTLQNRYSFATDATDSVGGANGTVVNPNGGSACTFNHGLILPGGGGGGHSGYVTLPSGILNTTASLTVEVWLTQNNQNVWATPWDFAIDNDHNFGLIANPGRDNGNLEVAFEANAGQEVNVVSGAQLPNAKEEYITVTYDNTALTGNVYVNGNLAATSTFPDSTYCPGTIGGGLTVNALGNDIYNDQQFQGTIYEFRIWNGVVSPLYLAASAVAGPGVVVTDTTIHSFSITADSQVAVNGNEQARVSGNLTQVSNVPLTTLGIATGWTSSNPGVLTVNNSGVITGVGAGTATVSATINGVTETSGLITVAAAPVLDSGVTLENEWSFNETSGTTAFDSISGANIAVDGFTSLGGGVLSLPGNGGNWAQFPNGILSTFDSISIETWLTDNRGYGWARAYSFGGSTTGPNNGFTHANYIDLIPHDGNNQKMETEFNQGGNNVDAEASAALPIGIEQHTVITYDQPSQTIRLYRNGVQVAIATGVTITPASLGFTYNNFIGLDQWNDAIFSGSFDEMRLWNGAVSPAYQAAAAAAGPGVVITNSTVQTVSFRVGTGVLIPGELEQPVVYASFKQVSGAVVTTLATNWVSSNPSVLTVSSSGLVTGVGAGTATVSATVGGVTGTSAGIKVVPATSAPVLAHRYSFVSDASDSVGTADGTVLGPDANAGVPATINNGLHLPGSTGGFGNSGYVSLPNGVIAGDTSITVECWATQNQGNGWAELWDFGNDGNDNFAFIPFPVNNNNNIGTVDHLGGNNPEIDTGIAYPNGSQQYVAVTYNNTAQLDSIYLNAVKIGTLTTANSPGNLGGTGGTTQNYLGNDVYGDWQFDGTVYEFRIWDGAVSPVYLAASAAAGPSVVVTNLIPTALNVSVATTMIGSQTQQAAVTGNFQQVSGVNLTAAVTNWTSSQPSTLSVNSSGLITANSGGTATISATVNGVTATSTVISVSDTAPSFTQKPASQNLAVGETAVFTALVLGGDLTFQWSKGASTITGATNNILTLTNLPLTAAGTYSVLVSNGQGSTNASAVLTVSQAILQHRYSFVNDASDSVGGANGTDIPPGNANGTAVSYSNGLNLTGGGNSGYSGYVALPSGILVGDTAITVECWVTENTANGWAEIWEFANNGNQAFGLIPDPANNNGNMEVAVNPNNNDLYTATVNPLPVGVPQYVCYTFDVGHLVGSIYTNGVLDAQQVYPDATFAPGNIGGTNGTALNVLGNDVYPDPQFQGVINEFRIWNGAVTPLYVAVSAAAGPTVVVANNPIPLDITVTAPNSTMIQGDTQPASATGDFNGAPGVAITGSITNWFSSNPAVLAVNSSGVITAVGTGSATISATVAGVTGTSASITVSPSLPVITQNPAASQTLLAGATLTISVAAIGTTPFTYFWFTNSSTVPLIVTNSPTLTVPDIQLAANGNNYTVVVSNKFGTATSTALALTVLAPSTYQQALLEYKPLAYWPLNDSGTIANDVINGYNGTYIGNYAQGQPGPSQSIFDSPANTATAFDGSSAYVDIPEGPFNITGAITIVAWLNAQSAPGGFDDIIGHGDPSWRMSFDQQIQPGANDGNPNGQNDAGNSVALALNVWHQVVYSYNGFVGQNNNAVLYVDGVPSSTNTIIATPAGDNLDVWIGGAPDYPTSRLVNATLADVSVFTYSFTPAQVTGLYNGTYVAGPDTLTVTKTPAGPQLNWTEGTLLEAPTVRGPWTPNYSAVPPYTVTATNQYQFFRLLINP